VKLPIFIMMIGTLSLASGAALADRTDVSSNDDFSVYVDHSADAGGSENEVGPAESTKDEAPHVMKEIASDEALTERPEGLASPELVAEATKLEQDSTKRVAVYQKPVKRLSKRIKVASHPKKKKNHQRKISHHLHPKMKKHRTKIAAKKVHKKRQSS
jgi:hypothetical protein